MPLGYWDGTANGGSGCYIDNSTMSCTPLDYDGNGDYNGSTYYYGEPANGYYSSIPGSSYTNTYFYYGSPTTLNSSGTGYWSGFYYIGGTSTTLDTCGNGYWNSNYYVEGTISESAYSSCAYAWIFQGSAQSGVDASGNGYSTSSYSYFLAGAQTTLDSVGSGFWNGHAYYNGSLQPDGYNGYYYYLNDVQTTLDSSGNGTWNGVTYAAGVAVIVGTKFVGATDGDWGTIANWTDNAANVATALPDGMSPVTILADLTADSSYGASAPGMTVDNAAISISITMSSGTAVFKNGARLVTGGGIIGDAEFRDTSYLDSGGAITGNATFKGNSTNRNDISGTVTGAHGGGINGSNVLGFA